MHRNGKNGVRHADSLATIRHRHGASQGVDTFTSLAEKFDAEARRSIRQLSNIEGWEILGLEDTM